MNASSNLHNERRAAELSGSPADRFDSLSTLFISAPAMVQLVRRVGLSACIADVAQRIERDFSRWSDFEMSPRLAAHSSRGVIELMPISDEIEFAFKYVNGHPANPRLGLPTVMAFGVLADVATGMPRLLSELTLATAIRTAAMSALAASRLARRDSRTMALIGNGAQSEFQAIAFRDLVGIRELRVFDVDPSATAKLLRNLASAHLDIQVCNSVSEAVRGADIVTTATADKSHAVIVTPDMVEAGVHLNAIGGDCPGKTELAAEVVRGSSVFVEYEPQTRVEGEIQQVASDLPVVEFWQVLTGQHPGRRRAEEVTLFDSVGFALEDFSALTFVRDAATRLGLGTRIELVPTTDDPRDLFGALAPSAMDDPQILSLLPAFA